MKTLEFAKKILEIPSPSGYTNNIINYLSSICKEKGLDYHITPKGNLIIEFAGENDYTLGLSAHVDTLGAMVKSIDSKGNLRFSVVGGPILPTYDGEYCYIITRENKVFTGTFLSNSPATHVYKDANTLPRNAETMHIRLDEKVSSKQEVLDLGITAGAFVVVEPKTVITKSNFIKSRFLDDKISVAILFSLIDHIVESKKKPKYNLKFIISTYEEVGHGTTSIPSVDEMIAVDMGCIGEDLSCTEHDVSICVKDSFSPYDFNLTNELINLAKTNKLNYAVDVYPYYSSDVSAALRGGNDIKGALIGPGVSASHGMERTHLDAVRNTLELLKSYINK